MTKKAALGVPSSQPHVNSPRLDKEDLSDDEDALAFRKPILGELCMSLRGGCVSRTHLGCTSHRLVRSGRREFAPSCLCGAALHCCRCDNHSRLGTNTVCVLAMHRSFVDSLSTVQVRRWFTSDNTFLRPIIISFVGAVAVLLPVPLTVCSVPFAQAFVDVLTSHSLLLSGTITTALLGGSETAWIKGISHLAAVSWRFPVCGPSGHGLGNLFAVRNRRRLLLVSGCVQGEVDSAPVSSAQSGIGSVKTDFFDGTHRSHRAAGSFRVPELGPSCLNCWCLHLSNTSTRNPSV